MYKPIQVLDALNTVHFYWASNEIALPPIEIRRNLKLWAEHLSSTAFVPILWVNEQVYQAILTDGQLAASPELLAKKVYSCNNTPKFVLPDTNLFTPQKTTTLHIIQEMVGAIFYKNLASMCYWHISRVGVWVINFDQFLLEAYVTTQSVLKVAMFRKIQKYYTVLNNLTLFHWTKDIVVDLIIYIFGGFYFDSDFKPILPFFESMDHIRKIMSGYGLDILFEYSIINSSASNILSLRKPDQHHKITPLGHSDPDARDVGMSMAITRCSDFAELERSMLSTFQTALAHLEDIAATTLEKYKQCKQLTMAHYLKQLPLPQRRFTTDGQLEDVIPSSERDILPILMQAYFESSQTITTQLKKISTQQQKTNFSKGDTWSRFFDELFESFHQAILNLTSISHSQQAQPACYDKSLSPEQLQLTEAAYNFFYRKELLHRFTQIFQDIPGSYTHYGYQYIEKLCLTGKFVSEQLLQRYHKKHHSSILAQRFQKLSIAPSDISKKEMREKILSVSERVMLHQAIIIVNATTTLLQRNLFPWMPSCKIIIDRENYVMIHKSISLNEWSRYPDNVAQLQRQLEQCYPPLKQFKLAEAFQKEASPLHVFYHIQDFLYQQYDPRTWNDQLDKHAEELMLITQFLQTKLPVIIPDMDTIEIHYKSLDLAEPTIMCRRQFKQGAINVKHYLQRLENYMNRNYNYIALCKYCSYEFAIMASIVEPLFPK